MADEREMTDKMTTIIMALPIRPQLKLAMVVEVLTLLGHMMAVDKADFADKAQWHEGDTVFSMPMRLLQSLDEHARAKNIGDLPRKEAEGMREAALAIYGG